ncbi:hypothetical protein O6H91_09G011800 [Diphasiastrum complanatum]|uniref:Uncharacterized protein n=1 Tax=Diphasiastrum complanatum TaxID=34168 RepID=A0ACC2CLE4_DIPCM|nr:hypothetical protein O6H91_09G011800 [Diphasiastrum complanatum]
MADSDMEPNYHLFSLPRCVPPRLVVNQNEQDDNSEDIDERDLPLFLLKKMSDDAFMQVISNMPLRKGGTFIANYGCRRLNRILATTARLVPVAYDPSQPPRPWNIIAKWLFWKGDFGVPWAYDPISNRWYKFPLPLMHSRDWRNCMWHQIASSDGLVCATYYSQILDYATYELELFDPYTQKFRTLPKFERKTFDPSTQSYITLPADEGYTLTGTFSPNFSVNIWMINPATCTYKIIVTRCMTSIAENSNHVFVDSCDETHRRWKKILQRTACGMPPGWKMQGSSAICYDILYSIFRNASLHLALCETAVGYQLFLHQFDLKSRQYSSNLYPMPEVFCFPGAAALLNCNNNLILVGTTGEDLIATSVKVWKFNPHPAPGWLRLDVMPDPLC